MFIARWHLTARFGKLDDCISVLRKWEIDVGERIGWKASSVRVLTGFIGASESDIEFEGHFENLTDLEGVLGDMARNPHHREYLMQLENLLVSGTNRWTMYRQVQLINND